MLVLGINLFHSDSSAALLVDGQLVHAVAEERLNRRKHFGGLPISAIQSCLDSVGASILDVDHLAVGRDPDSHNLVRLLYGARNPSKVLNLARLRARSQSLKDIRGLISKSLDVDPAKVGFVQHNVEHHIAHVASAFYCSPWDHAAGLSFDGSGDFVSTMLARCEGSDIVVQERVFIPHSLGLFYSMICDFIGYRNYGDEGKVMGLAALGDDSFKHEVARIVIQKSNTFKLDLDYFVPMGSNLGIDIDDRGEVTVPRQFSEKMVELFGTPRDPGGAIEERDMHLAWAMQDRFEQIFFHLLSSLNRRVRTEDLVLAGGCALNSVANGKIFSETPFRRTWIQPAAGDEGLSLGAALYCWHAMLGHERSFVMEHPFWGPAFEDDAIESALERNGIKARRLERGPLLEETAQHIAGGKVVGWFQGRMEWGPRALGNRSIIAHPGLEGMKDTLNARIKHRERFRPFAPSILAERVGEYFEHDHPSPFMLHVYKIRADKRERLVAVRHVDDTGRLQTVARHENPLYYDLICEFERVTGLPVVLNTSFNENEPIVCTPDEAIDCFKRTEMDVLVVGSFVSSRLGP